MYGSATYLGCFYVQKDSRLVLIIFRILIARLVGGPVRAKLAVKVRGKCILNNIVGTIYVITRDGRKIKVLGGWFNSVQCPESTVREMRLISSSWE